MRLLRRAIALCAATAGSLELSAINRGQLVVVPVAHQTAGIKAHVASLAAAITNLRILNSPVTEAEFHAHQAGSALPPVASLVMAPTSTPTS